jgi:ubiquinone/menaquinone biosynthesis C-methylase UbiE
MSKDVANHYSQGTLGKAIESALEATIGSDRAATIDDLAPVDEFHIGGRPASVHLFDQLNLSESDSALDVGTGIGGTARFVAQNYGCKVEGIDLTPEFCEVAGQLNDLVGLSDMVSITEGSALDMPYADDSFSVAFMMHVGMNIEDKLSLYKEIRRVLKPGGLLAVYDVLQGPTTEGFEFPVPWATVADTSFLATPDQMTEYLTAAGFSIEKTTDRTQFAKEFFAAIIPPAGGAPPPLGLHLIIGNDAPTKLKNMVVNINAGRCGPVEIIARSV